MDTSIDIKIPIWKNRSFGIADFRLQGTGKIIVTCSYLDKTGNKSFPHQYSMDKSRAIRFPFVKVGPHPGREIPVDNFDVVR